MPYKKILIALECTDEEETVIHEAIRLVRAFNAELSVLHVNDPAAGKAHLMMGGLPLVREEDLREQFRKAGYDKEASELKVAIVESESYANEIAKATENIDLLIMGHTPKNLFLAALVDSVDERVADRISCPVLVVPKK
ncbi:MAG: universal stress protein [bacterium]